MKLDKTVVQRRVDLMAAEGVVSMRKHNDGARVDA